MSAFMIDTDNNITALASVEGAAGEVFTSEEALSALAANWPGSRLVEIWNGLTGVTPVKKFKDRATGVTRIWSAIQSLEGVAQEQAGTTPDVAPGIEQSTPAVAPEEAPATDIPTAEDGAPKAAREGSKKAIVLDLLKREGGVSLEELMATTGWQKHSVRGFISGALVKKGIAVESFKRDDGQRAYRVTV